MVIYAEVQQYGLVKVFKLQSVSIKDCWRVQLYFACLVNSWGHLRSCLSSLRSGLDLRSSGLYLGHGTGRATRAGLAHGLPRVRVRVGDSVPHENPYPSYGSTGSSGVQTPPETASTVATCYLHTTRKRAGLLVFKCFYIFLPSTTTHTHQTSITATTNPKIERIGRGRMGEATHSPTRYVFCSKWRAAS